MYHTGHVLMVDGKEIMAEVQGAVAAYKDGDADSLGYNIGRLMAKLLLEAGQKQQRLGKPVLRGKVDPRSVVRGLLEGFGTEIPDLEKCIGEWPKVAGRDGSRAALPSLGESGDIEADLEKAIREIEKRTPDEVRKGLQVGRCRFGLVS